jgi:hypothetical protein
MMSNPNNESATLLLEFAAIQKQIGELTMNAEAQRQALRRLLPEFASEFLAQMESPSIRQIRQEYEHRVSVLIEAHRKISS